MEGALKLKEVSYLHAEAMPAGELKHGALALIEEGTPVVAALTQDDVYDKAMSGLWETKARGARVVAVAFDDDEEADRCADRVLRIPRTDGLAGPGAGRRSPAVAGLSHRPGSGMRHRSAPQPGQKRDGGVSGVGRSAAWVRPYAREGGPAMGNIVGIGTDMVEIGRVERLLARYPRFADRCFTAGGAGIRGSVRPPRPPVGGPVRREGSGDEIPGNRVSDHPLDRH